jgi:hypothetical protein
MKVSVSLLESDKQIRSEILSAIRDILNKAIDKTITNIRSKIEIILAEALRSEPEYSSLISGELRKEFGIEDTKNVDIAIANLISSLDIQKKPISFNNQGITGGISITAVPSSDFGGALADYSAYVVDEERGYKLPWLEWLLLRGTEIIIRNFEVKYGPNPRSRSGDAIMVGGGNWRVPPAYAGTERDNWTTRAFSKIDDQLTDIIKKSIESNI